MAFEEDEAQERNRIGQLIKSALTAKSMSMRKLCRVIGIDTATVSRIVNGKQQPKLEHLKLFAQHLDIPLLDLLATAGLEPLEQKDGIGELRAALQGIGINVDDMASQVRKELHKYEAYARTEEGKEIIEKSFLPKLEQLRSAGYYIEQLKDLYKEYSSGQLPEAEQHVIGSALLYFVLSADVIPDFSFPFGYIDDAIAVRIVIERLAKMRRPS
ncbi:helix-turn-helix domain-containing protein [Paenibacillus sp. KQZ6P-2]|uniref:Helix-turn-helix domain-containing protein n=1 Tax=Paenibacillus mangrovi TaxID=2931978 RepID=A0A9X2B1K8_9BACL|nr:helix-turn-helix domain-containing protein [Paenibacillus mangrovi]MCJ8011341.1 helix-turn-helix domain-containing protein [Paenibacillus mangrovi]